MSNEPLTPEQVLELAQAALSPGTPVKVKSYVKRSPTGKQVVVRQAIRGAVGRTAITPPTAQTAPVVSDAALRAEAAAARAGVAQQQAALAQRRAAQAQARKQAAAALRAQRQQQKANKQKQPKAAKAPAQPKSKPPKLPRLSSALMGISALRGLHGGGGLYALRGRPGRLFPGSRALGNSISRSRQAKEAKLHKAQSAQTGLVKAQERAARDAQTKTERAARAVVPTRDAKISRAPLSPAHKALYEKAARGAGEQARKELEAIHGRYTESAHRALEIAAMHRRTHTRGRHAVGPDFHARLAQAGVSSEIIALSDQLDTEAVTQAQEALRMEGYAVEVTGTMNDETADALASFLEREGYDIDADY